MGGATGSGENCVMGETNYEIGPTTLAMDYNATGATPFSGPVLILQSDNNPGGGGTDALNAFGRSYPPGSQAWESNAVATAVVGVGLENGQGTSEMGSSGK
jgi:hypothetical protein